VIRYQPRHRRAPAARILLFLSVSLAAFMAALIALSPSPVVCAPLGTRLAICAVCAAVFVPSYAAVYL
jgi:hypothetical protein